MSRDVTPQPKPRRRDRSRRGVDACRAKCRAEGRCRQCARVPSGHPLDSLNAAHLIGGSLREWVPAAVVPLCGSGTTGCHHDFDNKLPARQRLWTKLTGDERDYVFATVGIGGAERRFGVNLPHPVDGTGEK